MMTKPTITIPVSDEPWKAQSKPVILLSEKIERYLQQKGSNELELRIMEEWLKH
jgi:hypothetical protein